MDGTQLLLSVIFESLSSGRIQKSISDILHDGAIGCVQKKGWMDKGTMVILFCYILMLYISGRDGKSGLLLDDFKFQRSPELMKSIEAKSPVRLINARNKKWTLKP